LAFRFARALLQAFGLGLGLGLGLGVRRAGMKGIVLEGVTASGKTRLLAAVQRQLVAKRPSATKLVLSEHYTDRLLEEPRKHGKLAFSEALHHVHDVISTIRTLDRLQRGGKFAGRGGDSDVYVIVERFLGSHAAYLARGGVFPTPAEHDAVVALYREMAEAGLRTVVLRLPADVLPAAVLDTRKHRSTAWRAFLGSHGPDDTAIAAAFAAWQEALLGFYASLPAELRPHVVDVPDPRDDAAAERLAGTLLSL
jgi:hypothetical protein